MTPALQCAPSQDGECEALPGAEITRLGSRAPGSRGRPEQILIVSGKPVLDTITSVRAGSLVRRSLCQESRCLPGAVTGTAHRRLNLLPA